MLTVLHNIWWLLVLIGVMILIHELGHYWAARFFDVRVETFSFGFGPRLFGFKKGETDFRFSAILFGGYVKMLGDQAGEESAADPRGFMAKPRWQRLIIAFAGPLMNILLAVAILTGLFMVRYPKIPSTVNPMVGYLLPDGAAAKAGVKEGDRIVQIGNTVDPTWDDVAMKEVSSANRPLDVWVERGGQRQRFTVTPVLDARNYIGIAGWLEQYETHVGAVTPDKPAEKAGLRRGDILISANGQPIRSSPQFIELIAANAANPLVLAYKRDGKLQQMTLTPRHESVEGRWMIGVRLEPPSVSLPLPQALSESVKRNAKSATLIYQFLEGIVERKMSARSVDGPIRIAQLSGEAAKEGPSAFFELMSMVSLNLAIFNLLPIPILDGGVILMLLLEMFMRRDLSLQVKEAVFKVGFVFIMALVVFVIYNDISKMLPPS